MVDPSQSHVRSSIETIALSTRPSSNYKTGIAGVFWYELARSFTPLRIALWMAMVLFPVVLTIAIRLILSMNQRINDEHLILSIVMFVLLPEVLTILCMLLLATPIVNAELESQTWVYAVVRPKARRSLLLGKYLVAVVWTAFCTSTAATISIPIAGVSNSFQVWAAICCLCWLSAIAYGALYMLIGTFIQRRAMVIAFAYTMMVEFLLATIPAVISKVTISNRLWSILNAWFDFPSRMLSDNFANQDSNPVMNIAILLLASAAMLGIGLWRIQSTQFRWQSEAS